MNLLESDNEGVGLNIYDQFVSDPYSANGIHSEITHELEGIISNVEEDLKTAPQKLHEDIVMMVERLTERNPLPQNLISA